MVRDLDRAAVRLGQAAREAQSHPAILPGSAGGAAAEGDVEHTWKILRWFARHRHAQVPMPRLERPASVVSWREAL
jgi:hypothetical protein